MKDEGFKQGSLFKAFILHPSSFILFFLSHGRIAKRRNFSLDSVFAQREGYQSLIRRQGDQITARI
jgi:hypothetical protein